MRKRLRMTGVVLVLAGLVLSLVGVYVTSRAGAGLDSLQAVYEAQGLELSYNEDGQIVDRGTVEGADHIRHLLVDEWQFPLNEDNLDPDDPLINTADELMWQFATISMHVLHGTQKITLEEDVEYDGEVFKAGTYEFEIDGRYWNDFDRKHPLEGPARSMAWSPSALGLLAQISAGTGNQMTAELAYGLGQIIIVLGGIFMLSGGGLVFSSSKKNCKDC